MGLSLIEPSLEKVGVELLDEDQPELKCKVCGESWVPRILADGRLPRGWWRCPHCAGVSREKKYPGCVYSTS
jgi:hypothetical protein